MGSPAYTGFARRTIARTADYVRLIILLGEDEVTEEEWLHAAMHGRAFDVLKAPEEDRYTLRDGRPFDDAR